MLSESLFDMVVCWWQNGPYKSKAEIFDKLSSKLTPTMKVTLEKYAANLVALPPAPEVCLFFHFGRHTLRKSIRPMTDATCPDNFALNHLEAMTCFEADS